jgi:hypothetical protein
MNDARTYPLDRRQLKWRGGEQIGCLLVGVRGQPDHKIRIAGQVTYRRMHRVRLHLRSLQQQDDLGQQRHRVTSGATEELRLRQGVRYQLCKITGWDFSLNSQ